MSFSPFIFTIVATVFRFVCYPLIICNLPRIFSLYFFFHCELSLFIFFFYLPVRFTFCFWNVQLVITCEMLSLSESVKSKVNNILHPLLEKYLEMLQSSSLFSSLTCCCCSVICFHVVLPLPTLLSTNDFYSQHFIRFESVTFPSASAGSLFSCYLLFSCFVFLVKAKLV